MYGSLSSSGESRGSYGHGPHTRTCYMDYMCFYLRIHYNMLTFHQVIFQQSVDDFVSDVMMSFYDSCGAQLAREVIYSELIWKFDSHKALSSN